MAGARSNAGAGFAWAPASVRTGSFAERDVTRVTDPEPASPHKGRERAY